MVVAGRVKCEACSAECSFRPSQSSQQSLQQLQGAYSSLDGLLGVAGASTEPAHQELCRKGKTALTNLARVAYRFGGLDGDDGKKLDPDGHLYD